jgi:hypothetical protein
MLQQSAGRRPAETPKEKQMTTTETQTQAETATPNLRTTRKEQAAKTAPAAKATPAAKAAPSEKATEASTPTKLRWKLLGERTKKGVESATAGDREYEVTGADDAWKAVVKQGGKTTVLAEGGSYGKAYTAVTTHNKAAQSAWRQHDARLQLGVRAEDLACPVKRAQSSL